MTIVLSIWTNIVIFYNVVSGRQGQFLGAIFRVPWWKPIYRKLTSRVVTFLGIQGYRVIQAWPVSVAGLILTVVVTFHGLAMKNDTLITSDITFVGLISIAIGAVIGVATMFQNFRRWLTVLLIEAGIPMSAIVFACAVGQALIWKELSPVLSLVGWVLLVRSLWICVRFVDVEYVLQRIKGTSRIQVAGVMKEFDVGISMMGYPSIKAQRTLSLYWLLAWADHKWEQSTGPRIGMALQPHATEPKASAKIQLMGPVSTDLQMVMNRVDAALVDRFIAKKPPKRLEILVQQLQWMAANANEAAEQRKWLDTKRYLSMYIDNVKWTLTTHSLLKEKYAKLYSPIAQFSVLHGAAPEVAFNEVFRNAPIPIAGQFSMFFVQLLQAMMSDANGIHTWVHRCVVPSVRACIRRSDLVEAVEVMDDLTYAVSHCILMFRNDVQTISLIHQNGLTKQLVHELRLLPLIYSERELDTRSKLIIRFIQKVEMINVSWGKDEQITGVLEQHWFNMATTIEKMASERLTDIDPPALSEKYLPLLKNVFEPFLSDFKPGSNF